MTRAGWRYRCGGSFGLLRARPSGSRWRWPWMGWTTVAWVRRRLVPRRGVRGHAPRSLARSRGWNSERVIDPTPAVAHEGYSRPLRCSSTGEQYRSTRHGLHAGRCDGAHIVPREHRMSAQQRMRAETGPTQSGSLTWIVSKPRPRHSNRTRRRETRHCPSSHRRPLQHRE